MKHHQDEALAALRHLLHPAPLAPTFAPQRACLSTSWPRSLDHSLVCCAGRVADLVVVRLMVVDE